MLKQTDFVGQIRFERVRAVLEEHEEVSGETFWVEVLSVDQFGLTGRVDNELLQRYLGV